MKEFIAFSEEAYKKAGAGTSRAKLVCDVDFMCRIDISLMEEDVGEFEFVVDEVVSANTVNLFHEDLGEDAWDLVESMVEEVRVYVGRQRLIG